MVLQLLLVLPRVFYWHRYLQHMVRWHAAAGLVAQEATAVVVAEVAVVGAAVVAVADAAEIKYKILT